MLQFHEHAVHQRSWQKQAISWLQEVEQRSDGKSQVKLRVVWIMDKIYGPQSSSEIKKCTKKILAKGRSRIEEKPILLFPHIIRIYAPSKKVKEGKRAC